MVSTVPGVLFVGSSLSAWGACRTQHACNSLLEIMAKFWDQADSGKEVHSLEGVLTLDTPHLQSQGDGSYYLIPSGLADEVKAAF